MSNSTGGKKASDKSDPKDSKLQFKTENIGRWAAKQENPFAAQNRKAQVKKQAASAKQQKVAPYIIVISSVLVTGLALVGLFFLISALINHQPRLPDDLTMGSAGAQEIQDQAQKIYNQNIGRNPESNTTTGESTAEPTPTDEQIQNAITAVNSYYQSQEALASDDVARNNLVLLEMETFYNNNNYESIITTAQRANVDLMDNGQKSRYWGILANTCNLMGDYTSSEKYFELLLTISEQDSKETHD